jgi:hypothetical protein
LHLLTDCTLSFDIAFERDFRMGMKIALVFSLLLYGGCSQLKLSKSTYHQTNPSKSEDFNFKILEISNSLNDSIIASKPWNKIDGLPVDEWSLLQFSEWLGLQYPKHVKRAELRLLKCHLATIDPNVSYTKDIEQMCWAEVERLIRSQLQRTAIEVARKAKLSPNRSLQDAINESFAARTP